MKLPEFALFASTPRRLCAYGTVGRKGNRIEHELYLALELLQRTLQWLLERLAMWSRIITEFLDYHRRTDDTTRVVTIHRTLQARCEVALLPEAHPGSNPEGQGDNHTA